MVIMSFRIPLFVSPFSSDLILSRFFPTDMVVGINWSQVFCHALPLIVSLLQLFHWYPTDSVNFWNKQGAILTWPFKFGTTFLSHTDLLFEISRPFNIYFKAAGPSNLH